MSSSCVKSCGLLALVVLLAFVDLGCQRSAPSGQAQDSVVAFVAQITSNSPDAPPSQYTVFMNSGLVFRFDTASRDLLDARLKPTEISALREALQESRLAEIPPANHFPPDAGHIVLGLAKDAELRRYAWTGDERTFGNTLSTKDREFVDAWTKAHGAIYSAMPDTWSAASNGEQDIDKFLAQLNEP